MKLLQPLFAACALIMFALTLALPVRASDATDYTVTVSASVSPTTIYSGQSATGSATASITGNNPSATQELQQFKPTPVFSIVSVKGTKAGDTLPSASINKDGSNLVVTAASGTSADTYTVTIQATYSWTDNSGTAHSPSGTTTVSVTVALPTVTITLGDHVQNGQSITGTIALSNPTSLPNSVTVGLVAKNAPPPSPQTNPPTPAATGMVTVSSSVNVPGNGSVASFTVTGTSVSAFLGDVYVTASSGATSSKASLTVWDVGTPTCKATPADPYFITNDGTTTTLSAKGPVYNDLAVKLSASASIVPASAPLSWISSAYPSGTQIGMVQNMEKGTYIVSYSNPQPIWNSNVAKGTVGHSWTGWTYTTTVPASVDTSDNSPYPRPYDPLVPISTPWSSTDSPSTNSGTFGTEALMASDNTTVLGSVTYNLTVLSVSATFTDWCCIVNNTTTFPATTGWSIDVSGSPPAAGSSAPTGKSVTIGGGGGSPITSGYDSNQYLNDYAGINPPTTSPSPLVRISFTK